MTRLQTQHQRLYLNRDTPTLLGLDGRLRALVLGLAQPADWALLSAVWRGVQLDLELSAPGIAVDGGEALALWFSLAEPVTQAEAAAFLAGLCRRYLPGVKPGRLRLWPAPPDKLVAQTPVVASTALQTDAVSPRIPPQQTGDDRWSAFVAPDLAAVFADDPALDMPPGDDAQADLLSRMVSISPAAFQAALVQISVGDAAPGAAQAAETSMPATRETPAWRDAQPSQAGVAECLPPAAPAALAGPFQDPRQFLLAVMNEATVPLAQRIEAARALLSHAPDPGC